MIERRTFLRITGQSLGLLFVAPLGAHATTKPWKAKAQGEGAARYVVGIRHVAFDGDGARYEIDSPGHRVSILDAIGCPVGALGGRGDGAGAFNYPLDVVPLSEDGVLVLDHGNSCLQLFRRQAGRLRGAGQFGNRRMLFPRDVVVHDGRVHVCDTLEHRILVFDAGGVLLREIGGFGTAASQLNGPCSLAVDEQGNLHVVSMGHGDVQVFDAGGRFLRRYAGTGDAPGRLRAPRSIVIGDDGIVHVADPVGGHVSAFRQNGEFLARFVPRHDDDGTPGAPVRLARMPDGAIYVRLASPAPFHPTIITA